MAFVLIFSILSILVGAGTIYKKSMNVNISRLGGVWKVKGKATFVFGTLLILGGISGLLFTLIS